MPLRAKIQSTAFGLLALFSPKGWMSRIRFEEARHGPSNDEDFHSDCETSIVNFIQIYKALSRLLNDNSIHAL
jgi:hypothetical protein